MPVFLGVALALTWVTRASADGVIMGNVTLSPSCPGPAQADRPCNAPFSGVQVELRDAQGAVVTRTVTSADGRFQLNAPAGKYTIRVVTARPYPRCESPKISILPDQPATAQVGCDTGIR